MSDQGQRAEEHREYIRHKHRPATLNCDQCTELMPKQNIVQDWEGTGWDVCDFCVDGIPDFVLEYIDILKDKLCTDACPFKTFKDE